MYVVLLHDGGCLDNKSRRIHEERWRCHGSRHLLIEDQPRSVWPLGQAKFKRGKGWGCNVPVQGTGSLVLRSSEGEEHEAGEDKQDSHREYSGSMWVRRDRSLVRFGNHSDVCLLSCESEQGGRVVRHSQGRQDHCSATAQSQCPSSFMLQASDPPPAPLPLRSIAHPAPADCLPSLGGLPAPLTVDQLQNVVV